MAIFRKIMKRAAALVLCAALALGGLPAGFAPTASAAAWYDPYMSTMKQWGVMNDGRPNDTISRAEMVAVLNRAFGFTRTGSIPFKDVRPSHWFYNDIAILYNEGIFTGSSSTTASPYDPVTREQVLTFVGRCLRYPETPGLITEFDDAKDISSWSSIYVQEALLNDVICGVNGNLLPKRNATRAEVAKMMSVAMGTLVNKEGETSLGGVFGNVTVNTSGATLKDTIIAGNLYLTGGVGLGNVVLDNVTVLGKIVVSGGGNSESSKASVLLQNVKAKQLVIDPATGQFVSVRAIGNTDIDETLVKSAAYIQDDVRNNDLGLKKVILDANSGTEFILAGNMKNITDKTPASTLIVGDTGTGSVTSINISEEATGSHVHLEVNAVVDEITLDTAAKVTGKGDIGKLNVSTNGSSCDILPEEVDVWPGRVAEIAGINPVDDEVDKQLSEKPNILSGYPLVKNIAPTSADVYLAGNKPGTLYWALTATSPVNDNDVDDLIDPSYGAGFLLSGSIPDINPSTQKEYPLASKSPHLSKLESGGTYYISAVLVDGHGQKSPVKAQEFTTPDNTTPAMTNNSYPIVTDLTPTRTDDNIDMSFAELADLQASVIANKNCDLYYVLQDSPSTTPTALQIRSGALAANSYGYGKVSLLKNTIDAFSVTNIDTDLDGVADGKGQVKENTKYDLYVVLYDGAQDSKVIKKTITTKDITPPHFYYDEMLQTATKATSVTLQNYVDENCTVYWAAYPSGKSYPKDTYTNATPNQATQWNAFLRTDFAKLTIANGMGAEKSGKVSAKVGSAVNINISGLKANGIYDVYYVAQDAAGNYSDPVEMFTAHTQDTTAPTASQEFTPIPEDFDSKNPTPYAYSTVNIVFSEDIRYNQPSTSTAPLYKETNLLKLYQNYMAARDKNAVSSETAEALAQYTGALQDMISLYSGNSKVPVRTADGWSGAWTVDYRFVQVYRDVSGDEARLVVSFVNDPDHPEKSALNLESGQTYYFRLQNITDTSNEQNPMRNQDLPRFTTMSAQVYIGTRTGNLSLRAYELERDGYGDLTGNYDTSRPILAYNNITNKEQETGSQDIPIDISFTATPSSTANTADGVVWDMIFWFDTSIEFELFVRPKGDGNFWTQVGGAGATLKISVPDNSKLNGVSVMQTLAKNGETPEYHDINEPFLPDSLRCGLNDTDNPVYEYALHVVQLNNNYDRKTFNQEIKGQVTFVTGTASDLRNIIPASGEAEYKKVTGNQNGITDVTTPNKPEDLETSPRLLRKQFEDGRAPQVSPDMPQFTETPGGVDVSVSADRPGELFYILAPMTTTGYYALSPSNSNASGSMTSVNIDLINRYVAGSGRLPTMTTDWEEMRDKFPNYTPPVDSSYGFAFPTSDDVVRPSNLQSSNRDQLVTGSFSISQTVSTENFTALSPNTDYLMYIVTRGASGVTSPVTVYKFKTSPLAKPVLWTEASGTNATIKSDMNATVSYKLFAYDVTRLPEILKQPFTTALQTYGSDMAAFNSYIKAKPRSSWKTGSNGLMNLNDRNYLVLDALIETIRENGKETGSLFDMFASESLKDAVYNTIISPGDSYRIDGKTDQSVTPSRSLSADFDKVIPSSEVTYCLVACGYAGSGVNKSAYAFTGAYPIAKPAEQIKVESLTYNLNYVPANPNDPTALVSSLTGTITVSFTDYLYLYDDIHYSPAQRTQLYANVRGNNNPTGVSQNVGNYINETAGVTPALGSNTTNPVRSITFDIDKDNASSFTIRLTPPVAFSGKNGDPQRQPLQISVTIDKAKNTATASISPASNNSWVKK